MILTIDTTLAAADITRILRQGLHIPYDANMEDAIESIIRSHEVKGAGQTSSHERIVDIKGWLNKNCDINV